MNDNLHPLVITFITGDDRTPVEYRYSMAINAILKPEQLSTVKALMDSVITTIRSFDEGNFRESQVAVENRTDGPIPLSNKKEIVDYRKKELDFPNSDA